MFDSECLVFYCSAATLLVRSDYEKQCSIINSEVVASHFMPPCKSCCL